MFPNGILDIGGAGKWHFFWYLVFGYWVFQKKIFFCFFPMKITLAFIWCIIYSCTMDGFFRILIKTSSELICTQLYMGLYKAIKCNPYSEITVERGTHLKTVYICSVLHMQVHIFWNSIQVNQMWPTASRKSEAVFRVHSSSLTEKSTLDIMHIIINKQKLDWITSCF